MKLLLTSSVCPKSARDSDYAPNLEKANSASLARKEFQDGRQELIARSSPLASVAALVDQARLVPAL